MDDTSRDNFHHSFLLMRKTEKNGAVSSRFCDSAEPDRFEAVPGDDANHPPTAVVALPLFYAGFRGRSVGILSLATRSNDSPLLSLAKDAGRLAQISQVLDDWYGAELARALGVIAAVEFWHP